MAGRSRENRIGIDAAISTLKKCTEAHAEAISSLEDYQRAIDGFVETGDESKTGFRNGYLAELGYLHTRRNALDAVIASMENYREASENGNGIAPLLA